MKVLFIGGTGNISRSVSLACIDRGIDLFLLTRGMRQVDIPGATLIRGDIHQPREHRHESEGPALGCGRRLDRVHGGGHRTGHCPLPGQNPAVRLHQFGLRLPEAAAAIRSSPSRPRSPTRSGSIPARRSPAKRRLHRAYRDEGFPITIVRPSHTYDTMIPVAISGGAGYTAIDRMKKGLPIIVHGDGTSLWTLTHAEDFAKGFVGLLGHPGSIGEAFHITSDESLTWNQIHRELARRLGVRGGTGAHPLGFHRRVRALSGRDPAGRQGAQRHLRQYQDQAPRPGVQGHDPVPPRHPEDHGLVRGGSCAADREGRRPRR